MLRCLARRTFTMPKFITHEAIASGLLNLNHCSAIGVTLPWQHHLTNNEKILDLIVRRMEADWTALKPQMRKAWGPTTLEPHHQKKESLFFLGGLPPHKFFIDLSIPKFPHPDCLPLGPRKLCRRCAEDTWHVWSNLWQWCQLLLPTPIFQKSRRRFLTQHVGCSNPSSMLAYGKAYTC